MSRGLGRAQLLLLTAIAEVTDRCASAPPYPHGPKRWLDDEGALWIAMGEVTRGHRTANLSRDAKSLAARGLAAFGRWQLDGSKCRTWGATMAPAGRAALAKRLSEPTVTYGAIAQQDGKEGRAP